MSTTTDIQSMFHAIALREWNEHGKATTPCHVASKIAEAYKHLAKTMPATILAYSEQWMEKMRNRHYHAERQGIFLQGMASKMEYDLSQRMKQCGMRYELHIPKEEYSTRGINTMSKAFEEVGV
jgi:hypothetical protein